MDKLGAFKNNVLDTGRVLATHYKDKAQEKFSRSPGGNYGSGGGGGDPDDGHQHFTDETDAKAEAEQQAESLRRASKTSTMSYRPATLHPYHNKILSSIDRLSCCGCRKRWQLAIMANIGFIIVFGIRTNFSAAREHLAQSWTDSKGRFHAPAKNWTDSDKGMMEGAFFYGYIFTQLPGGFLAAKFAPNKLFGIALASACACNLLMPAALQHSVFAVIMVQMAQGVVQGVSYPAMHGVWRYWAPPLERSKLATTAFTGSYAGAVIGLPLSAFLVAEVGWAAPYFVYGVAGLIWFMFWLCMVFERPSMHPTITDDERKHFETSMGKTSNAQISLGNIPWKCILTSMPVWAIIVANFARSWTFYLLLNHQLMYMQNRLGMKLAESGMWAAVPHAVMAVMVLVGGQLADWLRSSGKLSTTNVRKLFNCGGFGGEAFFLLFVGFANSAFPAMVALILAVGCSGFAISGFNVNHLDIAPRYAALLMGMSNGVGTFSGMICPVVTEKFIDPKTGDPVLGWRSVFLLASFIHFSGVIFYGLFASGEQQPWAEPPDEQEPAIDDFAKRAENVSIQGYGSTANETIAPLPTGSALMRNADYYQQQDLRYQPAVATQPPPAANNHQNPFV